MECKSIISYLFVSALIPCLISCQIEQSDQLPRIDLSDGDNQMFTFTNKVSGFFTGNSHHENTVGHDGWTVNEKHYLKDYRIFIDGNPLKRDSLLRFEYYPHQFIRQFNFGVKEQFMLLDSMNALLLEIDLPTSHACSIVPVLHRQIPGKDIRLSRSKPDISISPNEFAEEGANNRFLWMHITGDFSENRSARVVFTLDSTESAAIDMAADILKNHKRYTDKRKNRLVRLIERNKFYTNIPEITEAVTWSQISLDALVTEQRGHGIWAGLPWFNNYWGRDTFISFAGALLVSGHFTQAKQILHTFSEFQLLEQEDRWYGRIPNRVTNQEIIYNTADGTWWFIREVYEYLLYSGDRQYVSTIFPVIQRAIEGALRYRVDKNFFLIHDDADTWMDAKSPAGAWSPRGNRAVEIQALWYTALQIGAVLAGYGGHENLKAHWMAISHTLRNKFRQEFWNDFSYRMADHINPDGSSDRKVRPNQIFSVYVPDLPGIEPLIPSEISARVTSTVIEKLTYRYGVASLWQEDKYFHPWHHYYPYYVPDEAYHNGLVWTWLAGPVISSTVRFGYIDLAYELFYNEAIQILHWDAVGNFSELLEAIPREGNAYPKISGTISQAWSLAEFARNMYQDFVGFRPDALNASVLFRPRIPKQINYLSTTVYSGSNVFEFQYLEDETGGQIEIERISGTDSVNVFMQYPGFSPQQHMFTRDQPYYRFDFYEDDQQSFIQYPQFNWFFAQPRLGENLIALQSPNHPVYYSTDFYLSDLDLGKPVLKVVDALGDDTGLNGKMVYPLSHHFPKGIFDITGFELFDLDEYWGMVIHLANLYDPNWHSEYGFQGTYVALAIRDRSAYGTGKQKIGRQASYSLTRDRSFHTIIYIGGGIEIADKQEKIIAQYVPDDPKLPLGHTEENQIRFRIRKELIPSLDVKSVITIVVGGQDDHGGAGIGEFRNVQRLPGEWHGGGADDLDSPSRVYDVLEIN